MTSPNHILIVTNLGKDTVSSVGGHDWHIGVVAHRDGIDMLLAPDTASMAELFVELGADRAVEIHDQLGNAIEKMQKLQK